MLRDFFLGAAGDAVSSVQPRNSDGLHPESLRAAGASHEAVNS